MIRICFLWHMHQPFYKDLVSGRYRMPWTRLHALKDYFGMVKLLREFPAVRATFNVVPSLVAQIEEYAAGAAREPLLELMRKPPDTLDTNERLAALASMFEANLENLISRYPRYRQLYDLYRLGGLSPERALPLFSTHDFADLQVLSQLAWFDELYLEHDPEVGELVRKGRDYSEADQQLVARKQQELIGRILGAYREAEERGQVELTTSPYYHPILPLICDTAVAGESHPGIRLPERFRHPEDARLQLERAVALHTRVFGRPPRGLWPSEGSVSDEALSLAADLGFRWAASGEGVLARSLDVGFLRDEQGIPACAASLYGSYDFGSPGGNTLRLFFRDQQVSDLIGFVYSKMDPQQAAANLLERLRRCGRAALAEAPDPVISVILDGENAWEYYRHNGREFLRALYSGLSSDPELCAVTFSEALELAPRRQLVHVVPGSWINANFDIWIGAGEDNRAWNLLSETRDFLARVSQRQPPPVSPPSLETAREELLIAEGSDWNWWYGPEHHSDHARGFDQLYRTHLANVYRSLGAPAPEALALPIGVPKLRVFATPPAGFIHPRLDGLVSSYFEWMGAGIYSPDRRTSAMHGKRFYLRELFYGLDAENFYLRLDFTPEGMAALARTEVHLNFSAATAASRLSARLSAAPASRESGSWVVNLDLACGTALDSTALDNPMREAPAQAGEAQGCLRQILELRAALSALGVRPAERFRFQVVLWESGLPVDLLPEDGWLELDTGEPREAP